MYPKSPKQEASSKTHVFTGNSMAICCAVCSGKRQWPERRGPVVRHQTVEVTEPHQASIVSILQVLASPRDCVQGTPEGWGSWSLLCQFASRWKTGICGLVKRSQTEKVRLYSLSVPSTFHNNMDKITESAPFCIADGMTQSQEQGFGRSL